MTACSFFEKAEGDAAGTGCLVCARPESEHRPPTANTHNPSQPTLVCDRFVRLAVSKCCSACGYSEVDHMRHHQLCRAVPRHLDRVKATAYLAPTSDADRPSLYKVPGRDGSGFIYFYTFPLRKSSWTVEGGVPRGFKAMDPTKFDTNFWYGECIEEARDAACWIPVASRHNPSSDMSVATFFRFGAYDAVVHIDEGQRLYDRGWETEVSDRAFLEKSASTISVAFTGQFSAGKTFILHLLCRVPLPQGLTLHTQGLSLIVTPPKYGSEPQIAWYDQAGQNSPITARGLRRRGVATREDLSPSVVATVDRLSHRLSDAEENGQPPATSAEGVAHHHLMVECMRDELGKRVAVENFLRNVAIELADVFIHVIQDMRRTDLMELQRIALRTSRLNARKDIIVIHNLRDWPVGEALNENTSYVLSAAQLFGSRVLSYEGPGGVDIVRLDGTVDIARLDGTGSGGSGSRPIAIQHFFLLDHRTVEGRRWNDSVVTILRHRIYDVLPIGAAPMERIANAFTQSQRVFATFTETILPQVRLTESDSSSTLRLVARPDRPPRFLTSISSHPDVQYNIAEMTMPTAEKPLPMERGFVLLQLSLPGLIGDYIVPEGESIARFEKIAGREFVVIHFEAEVCMEPPLESASATCATYFFKDLFNQATIPTLSEERRPLPGGTRPEFNPHRKRRITFYQIFDIRHLVKSQTPVFVDYSLGVLTVAFWKKFYYNKAVKTAAAA